MLHSGAHGRGGASSSYLKATYRFNYLTLPLQVVDALRADGQGAQVFAGGYVGSLLGGNYDYQNSYSATYPGEATGGGSKKSGLVVWGDYFPNNSNIHGYADDGFYSRALDAGLQAGLGYRFGRALVQASYSHGLRNLAADLACGSGSNRQLIDSGVTYRNRAWQASFSYLFIPKN